MASRLLVVDDDEVSCRLITGIFTAEGFHVEAAHDGASGLERALSGPLDLVLLDLALPEFDGLELLERLRTANPSLPVVMLTASRDVRKAVRAIQLGAFDYLTKPFDQDEIVVVVRRALETQALRLEVEQLRQKVSEVGVKSLTTQMGPSPQVKQIVEQVGVVAGSDFTVLILGETGTGKELVAHAIHQLSGRRQKPFVALDCGAIPEALLESELFGHERGAFTGADRRTRGRFQLADGGTCFLDEVGNLPMALQVKLLRALESKQIQPVGADRTSPVDIRFIAATNQDLQQRTAQGLFRPDLYFRLAQYTISLPPLRERSSDIPYLTRRFLDEASVELRRPIQDVVPDALDLLERYSWPGNVRELRNVIRQAVLQTRQLVIRADAVRPALGKPDAPTSMAVARAPAQSLKEIAYQAARAAERDAICETLRATAGNKSQAARTLKTDYKTLHLKMKYLGIRARDSTP